MITDTIMLNIDHLESLNISFIINNLLKHYKFKN